MMLSVVGEGFVVQREADDVHTLLEHLPVDAIGLGFVGIVEAPDHRAKAFRFSRHCPTAHAQDPATTGEVVQSGEVFSQPQWVPLGNDVEEGADPNSAGALGQHSSEQQSVGYDLVAFVLEVVLCQPEDVEPHLLCLHPHLQHPFGGVPDRLVVVPAVG